MHLLLNKDLCGGDESLTLQHLQKRCGQLHDRADGCGLTDSTLEQYHLEQWSLSRSQHLAS